jgi:hypothetical protein
LENVDIFYGHLEYFTDIRDILRPFGTFVFIWYISSGFGIMYREKSGNPALKHGFNAEAKLRQDPSFVETSISDLMTL